MNLPFELQVQIISYLSLRTSLQVSRRVRELIIGFAENHNYYDDYVNLHMLLFYDKEDMPLQHHYYNGHVGRINLMPLICSATQNSCLEIDYKQDKYRWIDEYLRCFSDMPIYRCFGVVYDEYLNKLVIKNKHREKLAIPKELILCRRGVETLILQGYIDHIPEEIYDLWELKTLTISGTKLKSLELDFSKFRQPVRIILEIDNYKKHI